MTVKKIAPLLSLSFMLVSSFLEAKAEVLSDKDKRPVLDKLRSLQVPFIENRGQIEDLSVEYYARTFGGTVFITHTGRIVYSLPNNQRGAHAIEESLVGAFANAMIGEDPAATNVNYFRGSDPAKWETDIPSYNSVNLGEVYPRIELKLKAYGNNVEKLFLVKPGADPGMIKISLAERPAAGGIGASRPMRGRAPSPPAAASYLSVNDQGQLEVETESGVVRFTKPVAYQELDGAKKHVDVAYPLKDDGYGFNVGDYDPSRDLIIDPLLASTFLGGSGPDGAFSIGMDSSGNVYVTGYTHSYTQSSDFPTTSGAYDTTFNGYSDVFVAKLDGNLENLLASTFLGGSGEDVAYGIAIDSSGNVYLCGKTTSSDFPATPGSYDTTYNFYPADAFVSKLDGNLKNLLASTFLGSSTSDSAHAMTIDSGGNVYVTGYTWSTDFPTTSGAYDTTSNGNPDVFVAKLDTNLENLLASTLLGGTGADYAYAMAIDSNGNVFVTGYTSGVFSHFPTTSGAYDTAFNGDSDVFVAKLDANLENLLASTFLGAASEDKAYAMAIDSSGNVFVAGFTQSSNFPITGGTYDTTHNGHSDAFVAKLDKNLKNLLAFTFLGGATTDAAMAITIDSSGNVYVTGFTMSSDFPTTIGAYDGSSGFFVSKLDSGLQTLLASTLLGGYAMAKDSSGNVYVTAGCIISSEFPKTTTAYDTTSNGRCVFVAKLDTAIQNVLASKHLLASTYLGGSDSDYAYSIATDSSGNVYVAGSTNSSDFPTTTGAYDTTRNGYGDAFVAKFDSNLHTLLALTYLGGTASDAISSIAVNTGGNVYVTGYTLSSDFPTTSGAYDTSFNGGDVLGDAFVSKLDANLRTLLASTYLGGAGNDGANSMTIASDDTVYVAGATTSTNFPAIANAYDRVFNGGSLFGDAFVSRLDGSLSALLASTFLGGAGEDGASAISLDSAGNAYVAGGTSSPDFPTTSGAYDQSVGYIDAFVSKLDSSLRTLLASTYLGGAGEDIAYGMAIDSGGNVYVAGYTLSADFPTSTGAYDRSLNSYFPDPGDCPEVRWNWLRGGRRFSSYATLS